MKKPKVRVITPTYDRSDMIEEALKSIYSKRVTLQLPSLILKSFWSLEIFYQEFKGNVINLRRNYLNFII